VVDTGWLGRRLVRTDTSDDEPFALGLCLLTVNTDFRCERDVARDPANDLFNPGFSPDGRLVAVVQAPGAEIGSGPIVVYDTATATAVRTITSGQDSQPAWSPDGQRIAFARGGDLYVTPATGPAGRERRVVAGGEQPTWVTAPACRASRRPPVRVRGRSAIVAACAPQPGRVTVTLRRRGRRAGRKSARAATGGTVTVRLRRPSGARARDLRAVASFRAAR
jgi:dipeptidyl aminopeptidase/acylaminoacyl peptidase